MEANRLDQSKVFAPGFADPPLPPVSARAFPIARGQNNRPRSWARKYASRLAMANALPALNSTNPGAALQKSGRWDSPDRSMRLQFSGPKPAWRALWMELVPPTGLHHESSAPTPRCLSRSISLWAAFPNPCGNASRLAARDFHRVSQAPPPVLYHRLLTLKLANPAAALLFASQRRGNSRISNRGAALQLLENAPPPRSATRLRSHGAKTRTTTLSSGASHDDYAEFAVRSQTFSSWSIHAEWVSWHNNDSR